MNVVQHALSSPFGSSESPPRCNRHCSNQANTGRRRRRLRPAGHSQPEARTGLGHEEPVRLGQTRRLLGSGDLRGGWRLLYVRQLPCLSSPAHTLRDQCERVEGGSEGGRVCVGARAPLRVSVFPDSDSASHRSPGRQGRAALRAPRAWAGRSGPGRL